jgi:outer membrane protein OmpA-like peptidoglycan-associated protein
MRARAAWRAIGMLAIATATHAQAPGSALQTHVDELVFHVDDLVFRVNDLAYHVDDLGGKVASLEVKETATELRIDLAADVLFDFDKAVLLPKAQQTLSQAAGFIRDKAKGQVRIEGYTDAKGSPAYNQRLSERRAAAVEGWFKAHEKLSNVSFVTQGFGAQRPVASNVKADGSDDPVGRQRNRRVEIVIQKSSIPGP